VDTTLALIPFPEQPGSESTGWSIARVVVPSNAVRALQRALSGRGVNYYPDTPEAGRPRGILLLNRYDEAWLDVVRANASSVEIVPHDTYDFSWRLPRHRLALGTKLEVIASSSPEKNGSEIILNPGLAFGDFRHASTSLCAHAILVLLEQHPGSSLLDVGCGSGILFLVAARLGATRLAATDISPYARYVSRLNASLNGVSIAMTESLSGETFDIVVANVWASAFPVLAEPLYASLAEGGAAVLAGFECSEAESVIACFPDLHFEQLQRGQWCALVGRRRH